MSETRFDLHAVEKRFEYSRGRTQHDADVAALIERIHAVLDLCATAEANPIGWGGEMVISFARSVRRVLAADLAPATPEDTTDDN